MKALLNIAFLVSLIIGWHSSGAALPAHHVDHPQRVQLNIVFHGLFSYIVWPDHIEILAPQVDEHVYKAGTWGKEFRLRESTVYHLEGAHAEIQAPQIDTSGHVVLTKISNIDRSPAKVFCSFILPLPKAITGLRRVYPPRGQHSLEGAVLAGREPNSIPLVEALSYDVDDIRQLNFSQRFPWSPEINGSNTVNLHVWAEPDVAMSAESQLSHTSQAFAHLIALFPDVDLKLAFSASVSPDKSTGIRGLNGWEENSLLERSRLLFPGKPEKEDKRGTEVSNCVGVIVLNNKP